MIDKFDPGTLDMIKWLKTQTDPSPSQPPRWLDTEDCAKLARERKLSQAKVLAVVREGLPLWRGACADDVEAARGSFVRGDQ